jgi:iron(III) transport system permease protein
MPIPISSIIPGIVQTTLRDLTGWGPRDYWFPEVRSHRRRGGDADLRALSLRLPAGARGLPAAVGDRLYRGAHAGAGPWGAFFKVSVPMARPAIAGGVLLALMETLADYGTVAYFGVQTFATGIYSAGSAMFDRPPAAQLALCLLVVALVLATLERRQRRFQRHHDAGRRFERMEPVALHGSRAWGAAVCLPAGDLRLSPACRILNLASGAEQLLFTHATWGSCSNSLTLAGIARGADGGRGHRARLQRPPSPDALPRRRRLRIAGIGYAVPGA